MNAFVSIIMPCRNEEKYIEMCIASLIANDYSKDRMELLIIDGKSTDGTKGIIESYKNKYKFIKLFENPSKIVPKALNIGIKEALGEVIIRADGHSTYETDYVSKCVEYLEKTGADNVGGPMRAIGESYISSAIALANNYPFGLGGGKFHDANWEGEVDTVYLGCWFKTAFEKYGYFNEKLARNQDIEFNARIKKAGGKVFITPEIKSNYFCRPDLKGLFIQNFKNGFWNIKTLKMSYTALSVRHFIPLMFVLSLLTTWIIPALWFIVVGSYVFINTISSLVIALKNGIRYLFILPLVFSILHISYGLGALFGIVNLFVVKTQNP